MAQILDLSKRYTQEQIESASQGDTSLPDLPAGGYVCKIIRPILNDDQDAGKANIELHIDIAEGEFAGYFQKLEDRWGFWGLRGWMSFKENQLKHFQRMCVALCNSNPGLQFNPFIEGGADIDALEGKLIGAVIGKEEYRQKSGEIRERNIVSWFTEVGKVRDGIKKIPELKKLKDTSSDPLFVPADATQDTIPF